MTPQLPRRIGKTTKTAGIDGTPLIYRVEDEDIWQADSNPEKAFCLQKLRFDDEHVEYRLCYYMIAHKPRMRGKWAFGQFAPMMTAVELAEVFKRAQAKGWVVA